MARWGGSGSPRWIRKVSEESPISNIKDKSDRSEDDPDRSKEV